MKKLVSDEKDFVGRIAYTFYKSDKVDFIKGFTDKHGRAPSDKDLDDYFHISIDEKKLEKYRDEAEAKLSEFTQLISADEIKEGVDNYIKSTTFTQFQDMANQVANTHASWLAASKKTTGQAVKESLFASVISSFIIMGITVIIYFGAILTFTDLRELVHRMTSQDPAKALTLPATSPNIKSNSQ